MHQNPNTTKISPTFAPGVSTKGHDGSGTRAYWRRPNNSKHKTLRTHRTGR